MLCELLVDARIKCGYEQHLIKFVLVFVCCDHILMENIPSIGRFCLVLKRNVFIRNVPLSYIAYLITMPSHFS